MDLTHHQRNPERIHNQWCCHVHCLSGDSHPICAGVTWAHTCCLPPTSAGVWVLVGGPREHEETHSLHKQRSAPPGYLGGAEY